MCDVILWCDGFWCYVHLSIGVRARMQQPHGVASPPSVCSRYDMQVTGYCHWSCTRCILYLLFFYNTGECIILFYYIFAQLCFGHLIVTHCIDFIPFIVPVIFVSCFMTMLSLYCYCLLDWNTIGHLTRTLSRRRQSTYAAASWCGVATICLFQSPPLKVLFSPPECASLEESGDIRHTGAVTSWFFCSAVVSAVRPGDSSAAPSPWCQADWLGCRPMVLSPLRFEYICVTWTF